MNSGPLRGLRPQRGLIQEELTRLSGIVERVTFANPENGYSVLKVSPFSEPHKLVTVVLHQLNIFAGCSMEFWGNYSFHSKHGEQFKAESAIEKKPATAAALEKYLGSGLIKGVGPKTASKIVKFFADKTLSVFEDKIDELLLVPGIANRKLEDIKTSWEEHKILRDVMLFLQSYGISTLFAVKIYKTYGQDAISVVSKNPYQLAKDIYGIGFFSADRIALSMGFAKEGEARIEAGIRHVLAAARDEGHCFLTKQQILEQCTELLRIDAHDKIQIALSNLVINQEIKLRSEAYYSNSLYFDELYVSQRIAASQASLDLDSTRIEKWVDTYCAKNEIRLSDEQQASVIGIAKSKFSILTGGPGCGKTTTTKVIAKLLVAMQRKVLLAAPTGRAAQRMTEVIGLEAKTIHRLLEVNGTKGGGFKRNESNRLEVDFLIVDECSMLDISLTASLLKALPEEAQLLFIGDPDQLPSVGAGNVLADLLKAERVVRFNLTQVFRQAEESLIIRYAHEMNKGQVPRIGSGINQPELWAQKAGCLFMDAEEATREQLQFVHRAKAAIQRTLETGEEHLIQQGDALTKKMSRLQDDIKVEDLLVQEFKTPDEIHAPVLRIPDKFQHIDLSRLNRADNEIRELMTVLKRVHPWSALHFGMTALDVVLRVYTKTIPEHFGQGTEIQVLSPQVRGSLGTLNLNQKIQDAVNPEREGVPQMKFGERVFREGDRVIQTRNNYDLGVYNGDIGRIRSIDFESGECAIAFGSNEVIYRKEDLTEIALAYAVTIHKSQGSEFDAVIIPVATQHFKMLFRNLIYTGLTRAKKVCIFVGSRKALALAVNQVDIRARQTALTDLLNAMVCDHS